MMHQDTLRLEKGSLGKTLDGLSTLLFYFWVIIPEILEIIFSILVDLKELPCSSMFLFIIFEYLTPNGPITIPLMPGILDIKRALN